MPNNYTGGLETRSAPEAMRPSIPSSGPGPGDAIGALADAGADFAKAFMPDPDAPLGEFSAELAEIENQNIAYRTEEAELTRQLQSADDAVRTKAQEEIMKLRNGERQGALSPAAARVRANNIIKAYSVNYPHLSKDIRTMANASMDNIHEIYVETFGDDPVTKAAADNLGEAIELGTTPDVVSQMKYNAKLADTVLKDLEVRQKTGEVNREVVIGEVARAGWADAMSATSSLAMQWSKRLGAGLTEAQATYEVSQLRDQFMRKYTTTLIGNGIVKPAEQEQAMGAANALFDNVEVIFKSSGTIEEKVKLAKNIAELQSIQRDAAKANLGDLMGGIFAILPPGESVKALEAAVAFASNNKFSINSKEFDETARGALAEGNASPSLGLMFVRTKEGQAFLGQFLGKMYNGQQAATGDKATDAVIKRNYDQWIGQVADPALKQQMAARGIGQYDWIDLVNSPNITMESQKTPALATDAVGKAASYAADVLVRKGVPLEKVKVDHTNPGNPFTIEGEVIPGGNAFSGFRGRQPTNQERYMLPASAQLGLIYQDVLARYGAEGVEAWLEQLGLGTEKKAKPKEKKSGDK